MIPELKSDKMLYASLMSIVTIQIQRWKHYLGHWATIYEREGRKWKANLCIHIFVWMCGWTDFLMRLLITQILISCTMIQTQPVTSGLQTTCSMLTGRCDIRVWDVVLLNSSIHGFIVCYLHTNGNVSIQVYLIMWLQLQKDFVHIVI